MLRTAVLAALFGATGAAMSCGVCVEDKIASTYDHALVTQALAIKHHIAFFHIDGPLTPGEASKRWLAELAASTAGIDRDSVRVAVDTLTISFAFDPRRTSLTAVHSALEKKLAAKRLSLLPLRVIERPSELKTARR